MDENELSCTEHLNFEVLHITAINEPVWRNHRLGFALSTQFGICVASFPAGRKLHNSFRQKKPEKEEDLGVDERAVFAISCFISLTWKSQEKTETRRRSPLSTDQVVANQKMTHRTTHFAITRWNISNSWPKRVYFRVPFWGLFCFSLIDSTQMLLWYLPYGTPFCCKLTA